MSGTPSECPVTTSQVVLVQLPVPLVLGTILDCTLYGVLMTQFYVYTYNFPDDGRYVKCLAYGMIFLETVQSGLSLADLFHLDFMGSAHNLVKDSALSPWVGPILVGSVAAVVVQLFFSYRIWVLSNKKLSWLCLTISFLSAVSGTADITGSVYSQVEDGFDKLWICTLESHCSTSIPYPRLMNMSLQIWLVASVVTDGIITISMLYLLKRECSEGTGLSTKNAISKIVRLTVETNLLTTTVAIIALVLFVVTYLRGAFVTIDWSYCLIAVIGKLYANALFASLNNRIAIREGPARNAATRIPDATLSRSKPSDDTSDCTYFQLDRPPSAMIFTTSRVCVRRSKESEGGDESAVIDIV
ncbi:hypothetical protein V8E53_006998 [Lactarius tabidus]